MPDREADVGAARTGAVYDEIGRTYAVTRRPDSRVQAAIWAAYFDTVEAVGFSVEVVCCRGRRRPLRSRCRRPHALSAVR